MVQLDDEKGKRQVELKLPMISVSGAKRLSKPDRRSKHERVEQFIKTEEKRKRLT